MQQCKGIHMCTELFLRMNFVASNILARALAVILSIFFSVKQSHNIINRCVLEQINGVNDSMKTVPCFTPE